MKHLIYALILTSLVYVSIPSAEAQTNHDWCDIMYSEHFFKEVPDTIYNECKSRFQWNINRDKTSMRAYSIRLNTFTY